MQITAYLLTAILSALVMSVILGMPAGKSRCPGGEPIVNCLADPCQEATCSAYPNATCVANYCGGCNTEWFTDSGKQVQCETTS